MILPSSSSEYISQRVRISFLVAVCSIPCTHSLSFSSSGSLVLCPMALLSHSSESSQSRSFAIRTYSDFDMYIMWHIRSAFSSHSVYAGTIIFTGSIASNFRHDLALSHVTFMMLLDLSKNKSITTGSCCLKLDLVRT